MLNQAQAGGFNLLLQQFKCLRIVLSRLIHGHNPGPGSHDPALIIIAKCRFIGVQEAESGGAPTLFCKKPSTPAKQQGH